MDEPEMKIVDVFVCKLRRKLDRVGAGGMIGTIWGRGYMIRSPDGEENELPRLGPLRLDDLEAELPGSLANALSAA
jgi:two-component system cell cycle response regulator CtrA